MQIYANVLEWGKQLEHPATNSGMRLSKSVDWATSVDSSFYFPFKNLNKEVLWLSLLPNKVVKFASCVLWKLLGLIEQPNSLPPGKISDLVLRALLEIILVVERNIY